MELLLVREKNLIYYKFSLKIIHFIFYFNKFKQ